MIYMVKLQCAKTSLKFLLLFIKKTLHVQCKGVSNMHYLTSVSHSASFIAFYMRELKDKKSIVQVG